MAVNLKMNREIGVTSMGMEEKGPNEHRKKKKKKKIRQLRHFRGASLRFSLILSFSTGPDMT